MHQFKNKNTVLRLDSGQVLARFDHDLGDANLVRVLQRVAQKRVSFVAALLRLKVVWFVKKHRVDFFLIHEVLDVDGLSGLEINSLKIFILEQDVFPFLVLVTLNDLIPGHFLAVFFGNAFVIYGAQIALAQ